MKHSLQSIIFPAIFALILLFNCSPLEAQNLSWKQPILAGWDCFSVDIDSSNFIYSLCETNDIYDNSDFFDTIPIPKTLFECSSLFIAKTDTNFNVQWIKPVESSWGFWFPTLRISPSQKIVVAGGVRYRFKCDSIDQLLPGGTTPPLFISQFDANGKIKWFNMIKNKYFATLYDFTFDSEENIILFGSTLDSISFGDYDSTGIWVPSVSYGNLLEHKGFIAKYSPSGKFLSAKVFPILPDYGGSTSFTVNSVICDNEDNIYMTGWLKGKIQYDDILLESKGVEIIVMKFNKNLELVWFKHFSSGSGYTIQQGFSLAFDKSKKNFYITGNFVGTIDFGGGPVAADDNNIFLAKYSIDGKLKWFRHFGCSSGASSDTEEGQKLYVDDDDFVYVGGIFDTQLHIGDTLIMSYDDPNTSNTWEDIFVAKFFANGDFSWATSAGTTYDDLIGAVVKDKFNHVFIVGTTSQGSHFGEYTIVTLPESYQLGFLSCFNDRPESNKYEINYGIEEQKNITDGIKIFPNPFIGNVEVEIQNPEHADISIQLIDLNGKSLFYDIEKSANTTQNFSYQLNDEPAGIYCFKITMGNNVYTHKIVKL